MHARTNVWQGGTWSLLCVLAVKIPLAIAVVTFSTTGANSQVVINEFLASNGRTNSDDEGDSEDWVELFNTTDEDIDLDGWTLSDDAGEPRKWVFPSITIPARGYLLVWASGKDRAGIAPTNVDQETLDDLAFRPTFIQREARWRYQIADPGEPGPPSDWNEIGFDDSTWDRGNAGFGYGDGDDFTELPTNTPAVFTRREFLVPNVDHVTNLILSIDYDDGFVAYLNGTRVAAANAPAEPINNDSEGTSKHEAGTAERFNLTQYLNLLENGTNFLALVGLNDLDPGSSDMSLHAELGVVPSVLHTNFQLEKDGEVILLSNPDGEVVDGVEFPVQTQDHSYGHHPDASGPWKYLLEPTPEAPNDTAAFDEPISTDVEVSLAPGKYAEGTYEVELSAEPAGLMQIYYTDDGTEPDQSSTRYTRPISFDRNTVLRIVGYIDGERATDVISRSYFVGESHAGGQIDLPILSISMEPDDYRWIQENTGARGRSAEREGYFEYFDAHGRELASTGFGMRLHGGAGRGGGYSTKKAYKAYFRGSYGDTKLRGPIIPETDIEEFDKLVLRSNFNDSFRTNHRAALIRDELIRDVHASTGALASHGTWCVLYVNMEFRGVYNIVERMDEEFCESYFGGKDWDVIKTGNDVLVGSRDEWDRARDFIEGNAMSDLDNYLQALDLIDVENFTSYMLVNIWAQNHDWPHNNWYAARPRTPDGKWIFLCWDSEFGIGLNPSGWGSNTFDFVFGRGGYLRDMFQGLLGSPIYRAYVVSEAERFASSNFEASRVRSQIRFLRSAIELDMEDEVDLMWSTMDNWNNNVNGLNAFANGRVNAFLNHVRASSRTQGRDTTTPILLSVKPEETVHLGRVVLTVRGQNMSSDLDLFVGDEQIDVAVVSGSHQLLARIPFEERFFDSLSVRVRDRNTGREHSIPDAINVLPPIPIVDSITVSTGRASGGEMIEILGDHFLSDVQVFFGDVEATSVTRVRNSRNHLEVITPPGRGEVAIRVINSVPREFEAEDQPTFTFEGIPFLRGDANESGEVDLSDAVALLNYLFNGGTVTSCLAALDSDRTGVLDLTDALTTLNFLFLSGRPLPAPFPECDVPPEPDPLECPEPMDCAGP